MDHCTTSFLRKPGQTAVPASERLLHQGGASPAVVLRRQCKPNTSCQVCTSFCPRRLTQRPVHVSAGEVSKDETGAPGRASAHQGVRSQATSLGSWTQPHRDKQMLLLKLQELKESHCMPVGWRDRLPAPCPAGKTSDTTLDKSAQRSGVKPQLCRPPPKPENFSLPTHIAKVESTQVPILILFSNLL